MSVDISLGPVRSGKSTAVINKITRYADVGLKVMYVNHSKDIRLTESSDNVATSHNSGFQKLSKKIAGFKAARLSDVNFTGYHVVGIDEGQFFDDIVSVVRDLFINRGIHVVIASLDLDFKLNPIGSVNQLIGLCEPGHINKLAAICEKCDINSIKEAGFSMKISGNDSIEDPGGAEKYIPVCINCYKKYNTYS